jgi:aldose 1-epimerase
MNILAKNRKYYRVIRLCLFPVLIISLSFCDGAETKKQSQDMDKIKRVFGHTEDGREVYIFTLKNKNGLSAEITNYGGIVRSLTVPDRDGVMSDIVLGFESFEEYLGGHPYFGALVGRYANRIAEGRFELDGEVYNLAKNDGNNHLHGGVAGFDKQLWDYEVLADDNGSSLRLTLFSPDGDEGYPGNLSVEAIFTLNNNDELKISLKATTDKATPVNIAHHGYFNLTGGAESVLGHELMINAERFTEVNDHLIPTGNLPLVEGTAMNFREMKTVGDDIGEVPGGYDHNYVLDGEEGDMRTAAILYEPSSGRLMEVITTKPGVQLYTGNFLDGTLTGKEDIKYEQYWGLCLETQYFPDSPNQEGFPDAILRPGEEYNHTTIYRFETK